MAEASEVINDIYGQIQDLRSDASDAMDRLESVAKNPSSKWVTFAKMATIDPVKPERIARVGFPAVTRPVLPNNTALEDGDLERYKSKIWLSETLDGIQTTVLDMINTGGTGLSVGVEEALFNNDRERRNQSLLDGMDLAGARTGSLGFSYPNSMTKAAQGVILQQSQQDDTNLSREITTLMADLAQKNVQFAISKGISIEEFHADFAAKYAEIIRSVSAAIIDKFKTETQLYVAESEKKLRYLVAQVQIAQANAGLDQEHNKLLVAKWTSETQQTTERVRALISEAENSTNVRLAAAKGLADGYIGMMSSLQGNAIVSLSGSSS